MVPELLLLLFTYIQHIVRTYNSRQSCLWSAEQGDQYKHEAHIDTQTPSHLFNLQYFPVRSCLSLILLELDFKVFIEICI